MRTEELPAFFDALQAWAATGDDALHTISYGDHPDQVIDLRAPGRNVPRKPLVLVLHGGFWRAGYTRRNTTALCVALARLGWPTANVEYRRLGPGAWRPMLDDVLAAREAVGDHDSAVAVGHSAGGHLALWLAAEGAVDAAVALGGVCDLVSAAKARLGDDAVQELLGGGPADVPDAYAVADPATRLPLGVPHVLVHGDSDDRVPLDHARAYARRARDAGDACRLNEVGCGHFEPIDPRSAVFDAVVAAVEGAHG